jgi:hypothetical protein
MTLRLALTLPFVILFLALWYAGYLMLYWCGLVPDVDTNTRLSGRRRES